MNTTDNEDLDELEAYIHLSRILKIKKRSKIKPILRFFMLIGLIGVIALIIMFYGPNNAFRDWYVTSAMTTMSHQYLANWFYTDGTINSILDTNKIKEPNKNNLKVIVSIDGENEDEEYEEEIEEEIIYEKEYEREILEKDPYNNDYKIIEIDGNGYEGYLVAIYDPSRIKTVVTKNLGRSGEFLTDLAENNDALIAINGGGFDDPNSSGTGGTPIGITISDGEVITNKKYNGSGGLIGFTEDNKLVVQKMNLAEAKALGIRDGVTFGPILIKDGVSAEIIGNGGWGTAPRTVIGQREDGIVLFLVLDGRTLLNPGAGLDDLIEIMENYGAINAANLDGGTSTALVVEGMIVNNPTNASGENKTRPISTAFILERDDENLGDNEVISHKLNKEE